MPTYPAKFVDLNTVLLFLWKLTFTTSGLSFSVKVHVLFCRSHLHEKHNILYMKSVCMLHTIQCVPKYLANKHILPHKQSKVQIPGMINISWKKKKRKIHNKTPKMCNLIWSNTLCELINIFSPLKSSATSDVQTVKIS